MTNTDHWTPWSVCGEDLTAVPNSKQHNSILPTLDLQRGIPSELRALGAAIGKVDEETATTTFGQIEKYTAANDNLPPVWERTKPLMIGITGKRNVGKSTVATLLEERYGFARAHAFDGGKEAARAFFEHITGNFEIADSMVYGRLKDTPSTYLPGNVAPRYFLEKFGHFMGQTMGVEWTLAMEIGRLRRISPRAPIVVESLVYEAPWFIRQGGFVLRLERPDHEGPAGVESDSVQAGIAADYIIRASSVAELESEAIKMVDGLIGAQRAA